MQRRGRGAETVWGQEHRTESKHRARRRLGWNREKVPWFHASRRLAGGATE